MIASGATLGGLAAIVGATPAHVVVPHPPPLLAPLRNVRVPEPPNLADYVRDRDAAIVLGKALFWEMQAGSDGIHACASCHFHAGADNRTTNDPGDFPFHRLSDVADRNSRVLFSRDAIASSQGMIRADFRAVRQGEARDVCAPRSDASSGGAMNTRRVLRRNAPTVINAAYNFRNFWDGRASNVFNGVNALGRRDPNARILELQSNGRVISVAVTLINASAASQAVEPPVDPSEMSCDGRTFPDLGRKLLTLRPLALQKVDRTDSVLGPWTDSSGRGLRVSYTTLIERAFQPKYWSAPGSVDGYRQMEANFSLFWGLAIQLYESTLVSDRTPLDAFLSGRREALSREEQLGLAIFQGKGRCLLCHAGPELTSAGTLAHAQNAAGALIDRMFAIDMQPVLYDRGFYNIGVAPTITDLGLGGTDPFTQPLSLSRQAKLKAVDRRVPDAFGVDPATFTINPATPVDQKERDAVDGAFKTPTLRNAELTGPYFHTGGYATLESVIDFYNRGGDRRGSEDSDSSGLGTNATNTPAVLGPLFLTAPEQAALLSFLKALTDERVRWEQAPFDHPQLFVPDVRRGEPRPVAADRLTIDASLEIPAVGAAGRAAKGLPPLKPFLK